MICLASTLVLAQEKNTRHRVQHFSHPLVAATQINRSELPQSYAAPDVKVLGDLDYGQTSAPVAYSATPLYRAFIFSAFGGETVEVSVRGTDRKAMVALTDSSLNRLAIGDTSLRLSLPNRGPYIECWYIVFRDFEKKPAHFTVQVRKLVPPATAALPAPVQTAAMK
jgi:hypothetical protein